METDRLISEFRSGTGSSPPLANGWQRPSRRIASHEPLHTPNRTSATYAYSEHVGRYRHSPGLNACRTGDNTDLYNQYVARIPTPGPASSPASGIASRATGIPCGSRLLLLLLLLRGILNRTKDIPDFPLQRRELEIDHTPPRMQHHIHRSTQRRQILPHSLAHPPLDAIPIDSLPHHLADGQSDARTRRIRIPQWCAILAQKRPQRKKVRHLLRKLFAASLIHALVISMLTKTESNGSGSHWACARSHTSSSRA